MRTPFPVNNTPYSVYEKIVNMRDAIFMLPLKTTISDKHVARKRAVRIVASVARVRV